MKAAHIHLVVETNNWWPQTIDALLQAPDKAMYDSKLRGGNLVRYFGEPEPVAVGLREPERKEPEPAPAPGGLSPEEQLRIRGDYFRTRIARCPRDKALLSVEDITGMGQARNNSQMVSCPMCGLTAELD